MLALLLHRLLQTASAVHLGVFVHALVLRVHAPHLVSLLQHLEDGPAREHKRLQPALVLLEQLTNVGLVLVAVRAGYLSVSQHRIVYNITTPLEVVLVSPISILSFFVLVLERVPRQIGRVHLLFFLTHVHFLDFVRLFPLEVHRIIILNSFLHAFLNRSLSFLHLAREIA